AGPMTGDQAKMGQDIANGVTLAVDEWNSRGGLLGKKIVVVVGDDRRDPREAVSVANKMVNERVVGVVGHFNSSCSIPASKIYNEYRLIQITPASTNPQLTEQNFENVFRVCGRDDQQGIVGAKFVLEKLGKKRIAVLHDKTTYGQGLADEFKKNVEMDKSAVVVAYEGIIQGDNDFTAVLTKVKQQNPDVLYYGGIYPEAGLLVKQMRQLGMKTIFVSGDGVIDKQFIKIGGEATEGSYLSFSPPFENKPSARHFIETYKSRYGDPGPYSIYAYDAANILLKAIEKAQSTDYKKLVATIHQEKFEGAIGEIQFDKKGDVLVAPYIFWIVKDGDFVPFEQ
ncbi:MAG: branched-chain amino acid ABC transporter substrate-binding protein, partial [candidate division WOR-3 bacterium]